MKKFILPGLLNQKRLPVHLLILGVSFLIPLVEYLLHPGSDFPGHQVSFFVLLFIQLELFILIAGMIFNRPAKNIQPTRKDMTRVIMSRFVLFLSGCFFIALVVILVFLNVEHLITGTGPSNTFQYFFRKEFSLWAKGTSFGFVFATAVFIFIQWQSALKREQKLREENLIFQNETLKNQVNPHFLFNSLNTLSSLISTQPDIAEKFTIRLSSIYRYILENISKDSVSLDEELGFIRDYFFLHKIRDDEKISLEINIQEKQKPGILPVSLQILVENAIKHNRATREEPLEISIFIEGDMIVVKNNIQKMATSVRSTGIGLKNLAERIKHVSGRGIIIEESSVNFIVKVPLLS